VMDVCRTADPQLVSIGKRRVVACHLHSPS